ncbi:MAG: diphthamide synthesis protein [Nanoarchaeota archaeon]
MKILYIESKLKNLDINISDNGIKKLPKMLFIAYSVQYKDIALKIKKQLTSNKENKIKITGFQQVLGCSKINTQFPVLFIGGGDFHYLNLLHQVSSLYIIANNSIKQIPKEEIEKLKAKRRAALLKFLKANNIGILISTKPGQENIELAIKLRQKLSKKGKNAFIFLSNNIDTTQFENFNIDSWVNTACLGLSYDNPDIINYAEISEI